MTRRWTARRVAGGVGRRVPLRPLRLFFPFRLWSPLFRLWLNVARRQLRLRSVKGDSTSPLRRKEGERADLRMRRDLG